MDLGWDLQNLGRFSDGGDFVVSGGGGEVAVLVGLGERDDWKKKGGGTVSWKFETVTELLSRDSTGFDFVGGLPVVLD